MTPDREARLQALLCDALDREPRERRAFLLDACDDPSLRAEVLSLLDEDSPSGEQIDAQADATAAGPPADPMRQAVEPPTGPMQQAQARHIGTPSGPIEQASAEAVEPPIGPIERDGARLGAYRLVRRIGTGGMGEVYLAERDDAQYRKQVAIKMVRSGLPGPTVVKRLRAERQILAHLDHPNIARLLDGGATDDGIPYLVMEYIHGEPIDSYCDARRLGLRARLVLFRDVCAAVHHAHRNLVVHRDLKPPNILVTNSGVAKLLDFGIAKLLDPERTLGTQALTQADVRVLTPQHAAPEQLRGDAVTTAADVYALGNLLYVLLCGCSPFDLIGKRLPEVARIVCEQMPHRPSARIGEHDPDARAYVAECRSTTPERVARELRGDLDTIVLTALRKEPGRRYQSAEQLAADVERYLSGMPLVAREDTWAYRTHKFVRRHRVAVAASALAVLMLAGFGLTMSLQAERIAIERDIAAQQRERAEQISSFLIELFELSDPAEARGNQVTAREILDIGATRIEQELAAQAELQALLQETIGRVYHGLALYDRAAELLQHSLTTRRILFPEGDTAVVSGLNSLGGTIAMQGRLEEAERLHREALATSERLHRGPHNDIAESHHNLAQVLRASDRFDEAEQHYRRAMDIYAVSSGQPGRGKNDNEHRIASVLNDLSTVLQRRGDYVGAERMLTESLEINRRRLGDDHPETIYDTHNLAVLIEASGDWAKAEPLLRDVLERGIRVFGPEHPDVAVAHSSLGRVLHQGGRYREAEQEYQRALEIVRTATPDDAVGIAYHTVDMAFLRQDTGSFEDAEALYREALAGYEQALRPDHQYIAGALTGLGRLLAETNRGEEAREVLERAVSIWSASLPDDHWQLAVARSALGHALAGAGRQEEGRELLSGSLRVLESNRGGEDPHARRARQWLSTLESAL
jgi:eukaryotic-like serine/threonine-protein kinase